ncbi:MAG TPA: PEP-utilizing enzyme, partial [Planctomycetota bacterium]|nr:PEP-utilizing enzyme [Planctomycetota bacterium]
YRENGKHYLMLVFQRVRQAALSLGTRDAFFLTLDELLAGRRPNVDSRKADWARYENVHAPLVVTSDGRVFSGRPPTPSADALRGDAASAGVATGRVRVILDPASNAKLEPGEILVAPHTDPGWTPLFPAAAAIVTEIGGVLSHGAVVARELGVPAVVNVADATKILRDGETITVDGTRGEILRGRQEGGSTPIEISSPSLGELAQAEQSEAREVHPDGGGREARRVKDRAPHLARRNLAGERRQGKRDREGGQAAQKPAQTRMAAAKRPNPHEGCRHDRREKENQTDGCRLGHVSPLPIV